MDKENSLDFLVLSNSHECERGVGVGEGRWGIWGIFKFSYIGGGGGEGCGQGVGGRGVVTEDVSVQL